MTGDSAVTDPEDAWLAAVVATPGLTALAAPAARAVLLEDSLRALPLLEATEGPVIDVGSGNGAPGLPLALRLAPRRFTLLDAERRKCAFLEKHAPANAEVVWGRVEEQPTDWAGVALAKALAPPPVAAEWCLPLVRPGGTALLWLGESADATILAAVAARLGGHLEDVHDGIAVIRKTTVTPPGFPRRVGVARKRPLG